MKERAPQFRLISEQSTYRSFCEALSALWETDPPARPLVLDSRVPWPKDRLPVPGLFTSLLVHFSLGFFLYSVPLTWLFHRVARLSREPEESHAPVIVYELRTLNLADYLPVERAPGSGGVPGIGNLPEAAPRGGTRLDPRIEIVSNPPHPDNFHQTILQAASPPDLKIPTEIHLPDLVLGSSNPAPEVAKFSPPQPSVSQEKQNPVLPARPVAAPPTPLPVPELALTLRLPPVPMPHLEVPVAPAAPPQSSSAKPAAAVAGAPTLGSASDSTRLVSLSVDPVHLTDLIAVPPGNREGAFSISPAGPEQGSPGGIPGGKPQGGTGGNGSGGDGSTAAGTGGNGGGGPGSPGGSALPSITGSAGNTGVFVGGTLPSLPPASLVYPVDLAARFRQPGLIVSTGPGGGGGLRVYGILHGQKIYTIYLPMPGKKWILQYCTRDDAPHPKQRSRDVRIQMEPLLVPPAAVDQFDFHRPPLPKDTATQMIILHGVIREDGSVSNLEILQGLEETSDQAALVAFGRWKFTPALRGGNPVAVEILVGIPAIEPGT